MRKLLDCLVRYRVERMNCQVLRFRATTPGAVGATPQ